MSGKPNLFDGDSDDSEDVSLNINKDYAERYEEWREAEVKRRLEDKYGRAEGSLSDSSSEEENLEELENVLSKDFFEVISSLKTRDPRIYNPSVNFFVKEKEQGGFIPVQGDQTNNKGEKSKPVFLRDYERKLITEKAGKLSDDESDEENKKREARAMSPTYIEEQQKIKDSFKKALLSDDSEDEDQNLLQKKIKSKKEKEKEEEDYCAWLKGEREDIPDQETKEKLNPLKQIWSDPKLDESEKFLRDYVLNKRYLDKEESADPGNLTDDEYLDEYMNNFERNYNFRFEEPDKEFLKRYPRNIEHSLRVKDTKRKERRKAVEQRKMEERKKKTEELKLLKSLKKKEILKKIERIKQITGNEELGLKPDELEEDFDPEAHDRRMRELFNDNYYQDAEDVEDVEDLNIPPLEEELSDDNENWDDWDGTDRYQSQENEKAGFSHCEDPGFNMDCDYDPTADTLRNKEKSLRRLSAKEKRKLKRQSRFGRLVRREKPVFDPKDKSFQDYVDEYYGIDYEDLIGDIPCRFKYSSVVPNSYGLTIEEILAADDKELNRWASIKKAYTIRSEHVEKNEAKQYAKKAQNEALKRKILPSLYKHENFADDTVQERVKQGKKKKQFSQSENNFAENAMSMDGDSGNESEVTIGKKKNKKQKKNLEASSVDSTAEVNSSFHETNSNKEKRRKKKTKKFKNENDQQKANNTSFEEILALDQSLVTGASYKQKKKKQRNLNDLLSTPAVVEKGSLDGAEVTEAISKKKRQKKRVNNEASSCEISVTANAMNEAVVSGTPVQKKKKTQINLGDKHESFDSLESIQSTERGSVSKSLKRKANNYESGGSRKKQLKVSSEHVNNSSKKNNRHKNFKGSQTSSEEKIQFSDARLKAYGIHPKKFKNKLKYGKQHS